MTRHTPVVELKKCVKYSELADGVVDGVGKLRSIPAYTEPEVTAGIVVVNGQLASSAYVVLVPQRTVIAP